MLNKKIKNWLLSFVEKISHEEELILQEIQHYFFKNKTIELNKALFERIHKKNKRRLLGITYTPIQIREELTKNVLDILNKKKNIKKIKIIDPCCGSGTFTITLLDQLEKYKINKIEALKNNVFFYDVDKISVLITLINLLEYFKRDNIDITNINLNTKIINYLNVVEKFDAFITNPPYVKFQNLDINTRKKISDKYSKLLNGSLGLSAIFLKKMYDDLLDSGVIGIITQNNFFTSNSAKFLRQELQKKIYKIDNFGSTSIFNKVTAYTCLIYLTKENQNTFEFRKIDKEDNFNLTPSKINNNSLSQIKWKLAKPNELEDLIKLEKKGTPLNIACRIWVGIATQFDKGFTVFKKKNFWTGLSPEGKEFEIENDIIKPLIRVADLENENSIKENNRGIIYPYEITGGDVVAIKEVILKNKYPKAYRFLLTWKKKLLSRQKGKIKKEDWYKWGRIQSMIPIKNKLLTKTFNKGPCFYFDKTESLFSNGYALTNIHSSYNIKFIQLVLNSQIFAYYSKLTSFEIEGKYQCYQKNFIERFCLPIIDIKEQEDLIYSGQIDNFLIKYYDLKYKLN
jgi:methylase of polypeptide subunit release factors